MIRCIAYSEVLGRMCGQHAYIFDRVRDGWVCAEHEPTTKDTKYTKGDEELREADLALAIARQRNEIEVQLVLLHASNIFLSQSGRCLPQAEPGGQQVKVANAEGERGTCEPLRKDGGPGECPTRTGQKFSAAPECASGLNTPIPCPGAKDGAAVSNAECRVQSAECEGLNAGVVQAFPRGRWK